MALAEGTKAPMVSGATNGNGTFSTKECKGAWTVLYFYPKDATSGCTAEACDFRDSMKRLTKLGVRVVGVSPDSVASHEKFITKYDLNFPLVSDEDHAICEAFDTWKEKSMYGRKYMGIERSTFLIGADGGIRRIWRKVKVPGHAAEVLKAAQGL
jgi:peroxiredoxin Q/BCP